MTRRKYTLNTKKRNNNIMGLMEIFFAVAAMGFVIYVTNTWLIPTLEELKPDWRDSMNWLSVTFLVFMAVGFTYAFTVIILDPLAIDKIRLVQLKPVADSLYACAEKKGFNAQIKIECINSSTLGNHWVSNTSMGVRGTPRNVVKAMPGWTPNGGSG